MSLQVKAQVERLPEKSPHLRVVFFEPSLTCHILLSFRQQKLDGDSWGNELKKMLKVNELNIKKLPAQAQKNKAMENTMNTHENALIMVATQVEDFDDLLQVQALTGLTMKELETMYYSII